ncbi:centrosomal protein of 72 kDa isoform 1-T1 [Megaptera novaeangliae]
MAPAGRLVLCEEKIRGKTGLAPHRGLAELRSLSIPGTYQEKITHLGNSLMNLTGLKCLDLSQNSLVSLEGIEYLAALERLNVYRNRISSLAEVFRLRSLTELAEVDFRLNPVVESKPDYCLSVVHTLPHLRQLDDRPVREREREASRLHFASEESLDSTQSFAAVFRVERPHHSRAKCTDPSAKKGLVMDADDEAVLNLIAECEWDLSNPPGSMSPSQQEQEASFQSSQAESRPLSSPESARHQCRDALRKGPETRRSGSSGGRAGPRVQDQRCGELPPRHLAPCPDSTDTEDSAPSSQKSSLLTQKGSNPLPAPEKYRKRRVPGGRFQAPADQERLRCLEESLSWQSGSEGWSAGPCSHAAALGPEQRRPRSVSEVCPKLHLAVPPGKKAALEVALLGLVEDRPRGGRRPRRSSEAFLVSRPRALRAGACAPLLGAGPRVSLDRLTGLTASLRCGDCPDGSVHSVWVLGRWQTRGLRAACGCRFPPAGAPGFLELRQDTFCHLSESSQPLRTVQQRVNEEISSLTMENKSLQSRLGELQQQYSVKMSEVVSELSDTRREMDHLRQHLDRTLEESSSLKSLLFSVKKEVKNADTPSTLNLQITGLQTSVERLSGEIVELKQHLEHYDRIHELTQMLQESHRSLVGTNEHLLRELGRARAQHQAEAEQLRWSYRQLKKTTAPLPSRPPAP